jgi:hypothetical protein
MNRYSVISVEEQADKNREVVAEQWNDLGRLFGSESEPKTLTMIIPPEAPELKAGVQMLVKFKRTSHGRHAQSFQIAKTQEAIRPAERFINHHEREKRRQAELPATKHFRPTGWGFTYRTATRPFTGEELESLSDRYGAAYDPVKARERGMYVCMEIRYFKRDRGPGEVTVILESRRDSGDNCYTSGMDSGRTIKVCDLRRIDHKVLTNLALSLDDSVPEICDRYDHDKDAAVAQVREKIGIV